MSEITANQAQAAIEAAEAKAREVGIPISIAIVDSGRNLLAFKRMDDALLGTIEVAQAKAYTARTVNMKTSALAPLVQPGAPLYGLDYSHRQPLAAFPGGNPVSRQGRVIGAVGISGGTVEQDELIADVASGLLDRM